jgi:hypothetical protein
MFLNMFPKTIIEKKKRISQHICVKATLVQPLEMPLYIKA